MILTLTGEAQQWATPRGSESKCGHRYTEGMTGKDLSKDVQQWPTPQHADGERASLTLMRGNPTLLGAATNWPSPRAEDAESCGNHPTATDSLTGAVNLWPTPGARDQKGENGADHLTNGTGRKHLDQLPNFVKFRFSHPDQPLPSGNGSSKHHLGSRRRLNPAFVCWLMGFPWWWTRAAPINFAAQEMPLWRSAARLRLRSYCGAQEK